MVEALDLKLKVIPKMADVHATNTQRNVFVGVKVPILQSSTSLFYFGFTIPRWCLGCYISPLIILRYYGSHITVLDI